jgi:hypothetical protein
VGVKSRQITGGERVKIAMSRKRWLAPILIAAVGVPFAGAGEAGGAPVLSCNGRTATMIAIPGVDTVGTPGADVIVGTPLDDTIDGRGGRDRICGRGENDRLFGARGRDRLFGGGDDDRLFGQSGRDALFGGPEFDRGNGGSGVDTGKGLEVSKNIP